MNEDEAARHYERLILGDVSRDRRYNAVWDRICARGERLTVAQAIAHYGRHELERALAAGWVWAGDGVTSLSAAEPDMVLEADCSTD
jgi:hypothetical protein